MQLRGLWFYLCFFSIMARALEDEAEPEVAENEEAFDYFPMVKTTVENVMFRVYDLKPASRFQDLADPELPLSDEDEDVHDPRETQGNSKIKQSYKTFTDVDILRDDRSSLERRQRLLTCFAVSQRALSLSQADYEAAIRHVSEVKGHSFTPDGVSHSLFFAQLASCYSKTTQQFAAQTYTRAMASNSITVNLEMSDLELMDLASVTEEDPIVFDNPIMEEFTKLVDELLSRKEQRERSAEHGPASHKSEPKQQKRSSVDSVPRSAMVSRLMKVVSYLYMFMVFGVIAGVVFWITKSFKQHERVETASTTKGTRSTRKDHSSKTKVAANKTA